MQQRRTIAREAPRADVIARDNSAYFNGHDLRFVSTTPPNRAANILKNFCRNTVHWTQACYTFGSCKRPKGACRTSETR
jgi:hypothetical protein